MFLRQAGYLLVMLAVGQQVRVDQARIGISASLKDRRRQSLKRNFSVYNARPEGVERLARASL
jgi:hypothetical protein